MGHMRKLIDIISESHQAMRIEDSGDPGVAAQLSPVRGMTDQHIQKVADWISSSRLGVLRAAKAPGKVLFVPAAPADPDSIDDKVQDLFKKLHAQFGSDPFRPNDWSIKTALGEDISDGSHDDAQQAVLAALEGLLAHRGIGPGRRAAMLEGVASAATRMARDLRKKS